MINKVNPITFTSLKMQQKGSLIVPENLTCKDKNNNQYNIVYEEGHDKIFIIEHGRFEMGSNKFSVKDDVLYGKYLLVNSPNERLGLGTVLHLTKLIELMENDLSAIKLSSLPTAVFFHGKFGFKADIKSLKEANYVLSSIIPFCFEHEKFISASGKAVKLFASGLREKDEYICKTNKIFNEVLDVCRTSKDIDLSSIRFRDDIFDQSLLYNMKLTREDILANKDFYNNLFKKYDIDYQID